MVNTTIAAFNKKYPAHLTDQIQAIYHELHTMPGKIANLEDMLEKSLIKLERLSVLWDSSDLENRRVIQKTLFPGGICYDPKNHQYLTKKINSFVLVTYNISKI